MGLEVRLDEAETALTSPAGSPPTAVPCALPPPPPTCPVNGVSNEHFCRTVLLEDFIVRWTRGGGGIWGGYLGGALGRGHWVGGGGGRFIVRIGAAPPPGPLGGRSPRAVPVPVHCLATSVARPVHTPKRVVLCPLRIPRPAGPTTVHIRGHPPPPSLGLRCPGSCGRPPLCPRVLCVVVMLS